MLFTDLFPGLGITVMSLGTLMGGLEPEAPEDDALLVEEPWPLFPFLAAPLMVKR